MLRRTEGIVLKTAPLGEADLIATFLTRDFGILKTFVKSPRKTKSRFGSSLEPLTFSRLSFWGKEDAALPRLTQCDILEPFHSLRSALDPFLKISELIELTLNFVPERDPTKNIFSLFLLILGALERGCDSGITGIYYKLKLLEAAGYLPRLDGCGRCGGKGNFFFISHGTVLCQKCSEGQEHAVRVSPGAIRLFSTLRGWEFMKIGRIKAPGPLFSEISGLLDQHAGYILERKIKSQAFRMPGSR